MSVSRSHKSGKGQLTDRADSPASLEFQRSAAVPVSSPLTGSHYVARAGWKSGSLQAMTSNGPLVTLDWGAGAELANRGGAFELQVDKSVKLIAPGSNRLVLVVANVVCAPSDNLDQIENFFSLAKINGPSISTVDTKGGVFSPHHKTGTVNNHTHQTQGVPHQHLLTWCWEADQNDSWKIEAQVVTFDGRDINVGGSSGQSWVTFTLLA